MFEQVQAEMISDYSQTPKNILIDVCCDTAGGRIFLNASQIFIPSIPSMSGLAVSSKHSSGSFAGRLNAIPSNFGVEPLFFFGTMADTTSPISSMKLTIPAFMVGSG